MSFFFPNADEYAHSPLRLAEPEPPGSPRVVDRRVDLTPEAHAKTTFVSPSQLQLDNGNPDTSHPHFQWDNGHHRPHLLPFDLSNERDFAVALQALYRDDSFMAPVDFEMMPVSAPDLISAHTGTSVSDGLSTEAVGHPPGARFQCVHCLQTFGRRGDMARHTKKHEAATAILCPVNGCEYPGNYRKDKVNQHIKNKHPGVARILSSN